MSDIFYFSGTHWDREWHQSFQEFRYQLVDAVDKLIDILESNNEFNVFHFDGQTVVLEDYEEIVPEKTSRLKKLISEGRIKVGPWYCMPDEFLVSGESLIRNLSTGFGLAKEWGTKAWNFGYVCDIFGHIAQMPQIFNGFGIEYALLGRGTNEDDDYGNFIWKAPDGSECITFKLGADGGYGEFNIEVLDKNSDIDTVTAEELKLRMKQYIDKELKRNKLPLVVLMDAGDHVPPHEKTGEYISYIKELYPNANVHHEDLAAAGDLVKNYYDKLPIKTGELNKTVKYSHGYLCLITNTLSSFYTLKQKNDKSQSMLENTIEPLMVMADIEGEKFKRSYIDLMYKYLLKNHAHDSICGCSIAQVPKDMNYRFDQIDLICGKIIEDYKFRVRQKNIKENTDGLRKLVLKNTLPFRMKRVCTLDLDFELNYPEKYSETINYEERNSFRIYNVSGEEIPYQLVRIKKNHYKKITGQLTRKVDTYTVTFMADVPAFGFAEYRVVPSAEPSRYLGRMKSGLNYVENEFIKLNISNDGTIDIFDKVTGKTYGNLCYFADDGEIGDGWFHVSPIDDNTVTSLGSECKIEVVEDGICRKVFRITKTMKVPEETIWSAGGIYRSAKEADLKLVYDVGLSEGNRFADVKLKIHNFAKDHRLRLMLPTQIQSDEYFSGQAFYENIRHVGIDLTTQNWQEHERYEKQMNGIVGKRDETGSGLAFISAAGLHECAAYNDDEQTVAITLLRAFRNTIRTDGEEECQLNRVLSYDFALTPIDDSVSYSSLLNIQDMLSTDIIHNMFLTDAGEDLRTRSDFELSGRNVNLSILKMAEDGNGYIARVFNPSAAEAVAKICFKNKIKGRQLVDLNEKALSEWVYGEENISLRLKKYEIKSIRFCLEAEK